MEIATTTEFQLIYPAFVLHKHWEMPEGFNDRLHALAAKDAKANRIQDAGDGRNVGDQTNHLGHLRHNFLMDRNDPAIAVLAQMVAAGVREYLQLAYRYDHTGDIRMMSDTFWQRRALRENVGINAHTHIQTDVVCTYYPRVVLDTDCPKTSLHRGAVRFYDPANVGKRLWPCNNPDAYVGGWYAVEPAELNSLTRSIFEALVEDPNAFGLGERINEFYASIQRRRPIEALGQKCGMDSPDAIAVDLRGNVMTCQNTGAKGAHKIGHVADFDAIALDTATHFAFRQECMACPVVQLCKGSCMFLEGDFFKQSCANEFAFNMGIMMAAVWHLTGKVVVSALSETA